MKYNKWNKTTIMLFFVILSLENFAYLIPPNNYIISGFIKFSDIGIIMAVIWTVWVYFCVKIDKRIKYNYRWIIIGFVIITFISSAMADKFFQQPVSWGFRSLRNQMICFILYFPLTRALQSGTVTKDNLKKIIYIIGTIELIIYTLQYLLIDKAIFTFIDVDEARFGTARLRFPYLFPLIITFISLGNLLNGENKKKKYIDIAYIIWGIFLIGWICKHRAPTLIALCTLFIGYLIWKKNIGKKAIIGIILGSFLIGVLNTTVIVQSAIKGLMDKDSKEDTLTIREDGQNYYLKKVQESVLFGFGMPNLNCYSAMAGSGINNNYYLADNGIFGFYYIYGVIGIIWLVMLWIKSLKLSYKQFKIENHCEYLLYFIFETGNLYIGMHWFYYYTLPFILMLIMLDYSNYDLEKRELEGKM